MRTYNAIEDGLNRLSQLSRSDQDWVRAKLVGSVQPQVAIAAARVLSTVRPRKNAISVFLSHNSRDKPFVRGLYHGCDKVIGENS